MRQRYHSNHCRSFRRTDRLRIRTSAASGTSAAARDYAACHAPSHHGNRSGHRCSRTDTARRSKREDARANRATRYDDAGAGDRDLAAFGILGVLSRSQCNPRHGLFQSRRLSIRWDCRIIRIFAGIFANWLLDFARL